MIAADRYGSACAGDVLPRAGASCRSTPASNRCSTRPTARGGAHRARPRATRRARSSASSPVVDQLGLPLPSRNGPHSGCPYAPQPARVARELFEVGPPDRAARRSRARRPSPRASRRRAASGRTVCRSAPSAGGAGRPAARSGARPTSSIRVPTRPARVRAGRRRASCRRARAARPGNRPAARGRPRTRRRAVRGRGRSVEARRGVVEQRRGLRRGGDVDRHALAGVGEVHRARCRRA